MGWCGMGFVVVVVVRWFVGSLVGLGRGGGGLVLDSFIRHSGATFVTHT